MTLSQISELRSMLNLLEATLRAQENGTPALQPGDVAHIRPDTCATFGGMLFRVTKASPHEVRGYPLNPHRGGCRQAWHRYTPGQLIRIGTAVCHEPPFARRQS